MESQKVCKSCQNPIADTYFFCPYCGKKLRAPPLPTSILRQIGIYFVAVFFPIFAVAPGISYIRQADNRSKAVGVMTLLLVGISTLVEVYYLVVFYKYFQEMFQSPFEMTSRVGTLGGL